MAELHPTTIFVDFKEALDRSQAMSLLAPEGLIYTVPSDGPHTWAFLGMTLEELRVLVAELDGLELAGSPLAERIRTLLRAADQDRTNRMG